MVFQSYALFPHMTVMENVSYGLRFSGHDKRETAARAADGLALVGLTGLETRFPSELSGGQQQRVAVARALVLEPQVLLFDEPLSNLDAKLRRRVRDEIRELQQKLGLTVVYVTHDQEEALAVSDRIIVMDRAVIAQEGTPRELYDAPATAFVADFIGESNVLPCEIVTVNGDTAEVRAGPVTLALPSRGLAPGPARLSVRPGRLAIAGDGRARHPPRHRHQDHLRRQPQRGRRRHRPRPDLPRLPRHRHPAGPRRPRGDRLRAGRTGAAARLTPPGTALPRARICLSCGQKRSEETMARSKASSGRLDDAARAGWLYYVAGRTQDEIATAMGISRQTAQRLVSLAVSEKLVRVWLEHPIARCLELASALERRFGLARVEVVPSEPDRDGGTVGLGEAGAAEMLRWLRSERPIVMAVGTGRTLKAAIDHLPPLSCPQHRVVSLTGNVGPDGSAAYYNVIFSMAEVIEARHFPMPLPVFVASPEERALMHGQDLIRSTLALAAAADVAFVGIGEMDAEAPLYVDRFLTAAELRAEQAAGAVGEICGWIFDREGRLLASGANARTASAPIPDRGRATVIALAKGRRKLPGIAAALRGRLISGLVTDEASAEALLAQA